MNPQTPEAARDVVLRQIGIHSDGVTPLFAYRDNTPVPATSAAQVPARPAIPVGAYVALGIGGAVTVTFLALAAAVLATAVAIGAVSVTICVLVLRSMWSHYLADRGK